MVLYEIRTHNLSKSELTDLLGDEDVVITLNLK